MGVLGGGLESIEHELSHDAGASPPTDPATGVGIEALLGLSPEGGQGFVVFSREGDHHLRHGSLLRVAETEGR